MPSSCRAENVNLPFQKHEEDLWVCRDVFHRGRTSAYLPSHNIAKQMNHILLPLWKKKKKHSNWRLMIHRHILALGILVLIKHAHSPEWSILVIGTFPPPTHTPRSQSSAGLRWGKWGGWCCTAPEPAEPPLRSEAPCHLSRSVSPSVKPGFWTPPLQPSTVERRDTSVNPLFLIHAF